MSEQDTGEQIADEPVYEDIEDDALPGYKAQVFSHTAEEVAIAQQELARLDWQGYMEMVDYMHSLEDQYKLPEAGGFAWVDMVSPLGVRVTFGERAVDGVTALKRLKKSINYAVKELKLVSPGVRAEQLAASNPPSIPAPATQALLPGVPPIPGSAPAQPPPQAKPEFVPSNPWPADYFKVLPQPDNRVTIEFWGTNRQYADFMMVNRPIDAVLRTFPQGWTAAHFQTANTYQVRSLVHWSLSEKTNKSGKHYKNVDKVEVITAA